MAVTSPLVAALLQQPLISRPYAVRSITSVTRERERFQTGDYVLVQQGAMRVIVRILTMVECRIEVEQVVQAVVRLWCDSLVEPRFGERGELWAPPAANAGQTLLSLEEVHMTRMTRNSHQSHDVYS